VASRYTSRVQVYGPEIAKEFSSVGDVYAEARKIARAVEALAILTAPVGPARIDGQQDKIKLSHSINLVRSGIYGTRAFVVNSARHAEWVHEGTANKGTGFIYPTRNEMLGPLPFLGFGPYNNGRRGGKPRPKYVPRVRGQAGQPWLLNAAEVVLLPYGVVGIYKPRVR